MRVAKSKQAQLSFRISAEQATALKRVAALEDRTVSAEIRRLIRHHLKSEKVE